MKRLILLRHSKSSWSNPDLDDFDRPLNNRGKKDAPFIAEIFNAKLIKLNLIICSGSRRTLQTAELFAHKIKYSSENVIENNLYEASALEILDVICHLNENINNVLLIAHNPGITNLVNLLCAEKIVNVPTSGLVGLTYNGMWKELSEKNCDMIFFEYPKKYKSKSS